MTYDELHCYSIVLHCIQVINEQDSWDIYHKVFDICHDFDFQWHGEIVYDTW